MAGEASTRGVTSYGNSLIDSFDSCNVWPVHPPGSPKGADMKSRLKGLWDFIILQLPHHFEPCSGIGAHCLSLRLGSLADSRLNTKCEHGRADGRTVCA